MISVFNTVLHCLTLSTMSKLYQKNSDLFWKRVFTDEALLAETTQYDPPSFLWMFSLLLKDLISDFYLTSLQLVLCRVAAVKRLPVHQP